MTREADEQLARGPGSVTPLICKQRTDKGDTDFQLFFMEGRERNKENPGGRRPEPLVGRKR